MIKTVSVCLLSLLAFTAVKAADLPRSASPDGAKAYIVSPAHGSVVDTTFTVIFGLDGMGVAPSGTEKANTGHHHLLIDNDELPPVNLPMGSQVKHFGGGQTQLTLTLDPGEHTLQLILGDKLHIPHDPPVVSEQITITVK